MIKEDCLNEVDEVYGLHNFPEFDEGDILGYVRVVFDVAVLELRCIVPTGGSQKQLASTQERGMELKI